MWVFTRSLFPISHSSFALIKHFRCRWVFGSRSLLLFASDWGVGVWFVHFDGMRQTTNDHNRHDHKPPIAQNGWICLGANGSMASNAMATKSSFSVLCRNPFTHLRPYVAATENISARIGVSYPQLTLHNNISIVIASSHIDSRSQTQMHLSVDGDISECMTERVLIFYPPLLWCDTRFHAAPLISPINSKWWTSVPGLWASANNFTWPHRALGGRSRHLCHCQLSVRAKL